MRLQPGGKQRTLVRDAEQPVADVSAVAELPGVSRGGGEEVQQHGQPGTRGDAAVVAGQGGPEGDPGPETRGSARLLGQPLDRRAS